MSGIALALKDEGCGAMDEGDDDDEWHRAEPMRLGAGQGPSKEGGWQSIVGLLGDGRSVVWSEAKSSLAEMDRTCSQRNEAGRSITSSQPRIVLYNSLGTASHSRMPGASQSEWEPGSPQVWGALQIPS